MNRRFRVPPRSGLPAGGGRPGEEVTITTESGCAEGDAFFTDGCTSVGDPNPPPKDACDPYDTICGGGDDSDSGTGGTGGGTEDTPTGSAIADDEQVDCHTATSGTCDLRQANQDEVNSANAETAKIRNDGICGQAKSMAQTMISNGLKVWSNEVKYDGKVLLGDMGREFVGPTGTEMIVVMHLWLGGGMNAWTIAHEALHGMGYKHEDYITDPDGVSRTMDKTAKFCSQS